MKVYMLCLMIGLMSLVKSGDNVNDENKEKIKVVVKQFWVSFVRQDIEQLKLVCDDEMMAGIRRFRFLTDLLSQIRNESTNNMVNTKVPELQIVSIAESKITNIIVETYDIDTYEVKIATDKTKLTLHLHRGTLKVISLY